VADWLLAGRSRADKEAEQDAQLRVMLLFGVVLGAVALALDAVFSAVGLQFGWWSAPAFAPLFVWLLACPVCNRVVRPVELDRLRWRQRLYAAAAIAVMLWVCWPWWAGPAAGAWRAAHRGVSALGLRYPLGAVLGASPVVMGVVAFLLLALGMLLAPRIHPREPERTPPPGDPEPLRSAILAERPVDRPGWPERPGWP
jgi:hypothetical protein